MKADIKARWVAELRSGKYRQAYGFLRVNMGEGVPAAYCCLGVLCEIAVADGVVIREGNEYAGEKNYLPARVCDWAGIDYDGPSNLKKMKGAGPMVRYQGGGRLLPGINDDGIPFTTIADVIDEQM